MLIVAAVTLYLYQFERSCGTYGGQFEDYIRYDTNLYLTCR